MLAALGYTPDACAVELLTEKALLPARLRLHRYQRPWLVVLETAFCLSDGDLQEEPLELPVSGAAPDGEAAWPLLAETWERALATLFKQEDRPRWAMLLAGSRVYLFDAQTHAQGRYLYVNLEDAYTRKQAAVFEAIAALLSAPTLAPDGEPGVPGAAVDGDPVRSPGHAAFEPGAACQPGAASGDPAAEPRARGRWAAHRADQLCGVGRRPAWRGACRVACKRRDGQSGSDHLLAVLTHIQSNSSILRTRCGSHLH